MGVSTGVVIPAYQPDLDRLTAYTRSLDSVLDPDEIRVELDDPGSPDCAAALRRAGVTVNIAAERRGKGAAITHGFDSLDTDIRMFLDADGATPASSAVEVLEELSDGPSDMSVGSRRHPDADIRHHQTVVRKFLGDTFARLSGVILPISLRDYQCGAKALTADLWGEVRSHLYERGFAWDMELVAMADAMGYEVTEVPIAWEDKPGSTVDLAPALVEFARALLSVRHRALAVRGSRLHRTLPDAGAQSRITAAEQD